MDLRQFISTALTDVLGGVSDAQASIRNGEIVPHTVDSLDTVSAGMSEYAPIDFEVRVRVESKKGTEAKIGVVTALVGGAVKGGSQKEEGHAATLKFRIPVRFPRKTAETDNAPARSSTAAA